MCMGMESAGLPIPFVGLPWEWEPNCLNQWERDGNSSDGNGNAYYYCVPIYS